MQMSGVAAAGLGEARAAAAKRAAANFTSSSLTGRAEATYTRRGRCKGHLTIGADTPNGRE
jgi:hypothetical protein